MKKENYDVLKAFTMIGQIGAGFLTPIGLCSIAGYYIDKHFHTQCWFIILFIFGVIVAFRNIYYLTRTFYEKDLAKEKSEQEYWEELKKNDKNKTKK